MNIIHKIKKHGAQGSIKIVFKKTKEQINNLFFDMGKVLPIKDNSIVFESEGDLSDNSYALYDYMLKNNYLDKYQVIWLVDDVAKAKKRNLSNVNFISKNIEQVNFKRNILLSRCKWCFFDHNNPFQGKKKREKQNVIFLDHGPAPFKVEKKEVAKLHLSKYYDYQINASAMCKKAYTEHSELFGMWGAPAKKILLLGECRDDYFYQDLTFVKEKINKRFKLNRFNKVFLWMPTFRQSFHGFLSENYLKDETKLPMIHTYSEFNKFNNFLKKRNIAIILKVHHLQLRLPVFQKKYSNILFLSDSDLLSMNIQLSQFIPISDALITDYSSVMADYILLDKPMVFTLDDYENYKNSRGLYPDNILDYLPGNHVFNIDELEKSMDEINKGEDRFKEERHKVLSCFQKYQDGNTCKRVVDYFHL